MYDQQSEISSAHVYYRELEDIVRSNFDLPDSMYQAFVPSLVGFYNTRAIWDRAEPFFTESLDVFEKDFGKVHEDPKTKAASMPTAQCSLLNSEFSGRVEAPAESWLIA